LTHTAPEHKVRSLGLFFNLPVGVHTVSLKREGYEVCSPKSVYGKKRSEGKTYLPVDLEVWLKFPSEKRLESRTVEVERGKEKVVQINQ
jgi:hypothetical protein